MTQADSKFWDQFSRTTGAVGCAGFVLIFFAASVNGGFDWRVFFLAGTALATCWARTWVLVPIHLRHENAEDKMWQRFFESDWKYVNSVSGLTGSEIDEMREVFNSGDDAAARTMIAKCWINFSDDEVQDFLRFFHDEFTPTVSAYLDETGRLRPFD